MTQLKSIELITNDNEFDKHFCLCIEKSRETRGVMMHVRSYNTSVCLPVCSLIQLLLQFINHLFLSYSEIFSCSKIHLINCFGV